MAENKQLYTFQNIRNNTTITVKCAD